MAKRSDQFWMYTILGVGAAYALSKSNFFNDLGAGLGGAGLSIGANGVTAGLGINTPPSAYNSQTNSNPTTPNDNSAGRGSNQATSGNSNPSPTSGLPSASSDAQSQNLVNPSNQNSTMSPQTFAAGLVSPLLTLPSIPNNAFNLISPFLAPVESFFGISSSPASASATPTYNNSSAPASIAVVSNAASKSPSQATGAGSPRVGSNMVALPIATSGMYAGVQRYTFK